MKSRDCHQANHGIQAREIITNCRSIAIPDHGSEVDKNMLSVLLKPYTFFTTKDFLFLLSSSENYIVSILFYPLRSSVFHNIYSTKSHQEELISEY